MEIEVKGIEKGYIISFTLTSIALIVESFEHGEFVVQASISISVAYKTFGSAVVSASVT